MAVNEELHLFELPQDDSTKISRPPLVSKDGGKTFAPPTYDDLLLALIQSAKQNETLAESAKAMRMHANLLAHALAAQQNLVGVTETRLKKNFEVIGMHISVDPASDELVFKQTAADNIPDQRFDEQLNRFDGHAREAMHQAAEAHRAKAEGKVN